MCYWNSLQSKKERKEYDKIAKMITSVERFCLIWFNYVIIKRLRWNKTETKTEIATKRVNWICFGWFFVLLACLFTNIYFLILAIRLYWIGIRFCCAKYFYCIISWFIVSVNTFDLCYGHWFVCLFFVFFLLWWILLRLKSLRSGIALLILLLCSRIIICVNV